VGDPFKDTSGPSMNILIKLTCLLGLVIAPILKDFWGMEDAEGHGTPSTEVEETTVEEVTNPTLSDDTWAIDEALNQKIRESQEPV
jgi:K(+)-stimulated pyrophosphate-energized sodium pump